MCSWCVVCYQVSLLFLRFWVHRVDVQLCHQRLSSAFHIFLIFLCSLIQTLTPYQCIIDKYRHIRVHPLETKLTAPCSLVRWCHVCCESHGKIHQAFSLFLHIASDQKLQSTTLTILHHHAHHTTSDEKWGGRDLGKLQMDRVSLKTLNSETSWAKPEEVQCCSTCGSGDNFLQLAPPFL